MVEQVTLVDFVEAVVAGQATVIDVRQPHEFETGHVPGAVLTPLSLIPLHEDTLRHAPSVYVICESGARSWQAADYLDRKGIAVQSVQGGMSAWRAAGLAVQRGLPA